MLKVQIVQVTPFQQNASIIWCTDTMEGAIVDAGGDATKLLAKVDELGVEIKQLILTHGHLDHAGGVADVKADYEARGIHLPVIGPHHEDQFWLEQIEDHAEQYGIGGLKTCQPDDWLSDGETVTVGKLTLQVLHCPGHTPGHVVFFEPESKVAFVGDVIFQGSIGRTDFPRGHHQSLLDSIRNKLWPLGDDVTFVPGHGPLSTFGAERKSNPHVADHILGAS